MATIDRFSFTRVLLIEVDVNSKMPEEVPLKGAHGNADVAVTYEWYPA